MSDYLLIYKAHIDETRRPKDVDFPKVVTITKMVQGIQTQEQLKDAYNGLFQQFVVGQPGIVVFLDETEPIDAALTFDKRVYIPWHMITHFHGDAKIITPKPAPTPLLEGLLPPEPEDLTKGTPN